MSPSRPGPTPFGRELRRWRDTRKLSQLRLASAASMSPRYLSFVETGRSRPSAAVVHRLAEALEVPLRERNRLLEAAGLAAAYPLRSLDDASLSPYRSVVRMLLDNHDPFPGVAMDQSYRVLDANQSARRLFPNIERADWLETSFAPGSPLREAIENFDEVGHTALDLFRQELAAGAAVQEQIDTLARHLEGVPRPKPSAELEPMPCIRIRVGDVLVTTVSTIARFNRANDITLDELRVELLFPADEQSAAFFRAFA